jgi:hypothetical protein
VPTTTVAFPSIDRQQFDDKKMFGGLPTPTETEAPDNVLTAGSASTTASVDYHHHHHHDHPDCDGSPGSHEDHNGHLTTSQSAHITLRFEQQK